MSKKTSDRPVFPFTSIVGQEEMKLSLILNVIDPKIGGVMIMGEGASYHILLEIINLNELYS